MVNLARSPRGHTGQHSGGLVSKAASNLGAQVGALASVSVASLMVARSGGPAVVGDYALLRVLPWLFAVVLSCGLPTASAFFLAGDLSANRRLRPTLSVMAVGGAAAGALTWIVCAQLFHTVLFAQVPVRLVAVMWVVVVTQLLTVTAKACCQGSGDIAGANLIIVAEELYFVVCYPVVLRIQGNEGVTSVVLALVVSGLLAVLTGALRLTRLGFFSRWGTPSGELAKRIAGFGCRGQLGNMLWLMNLRFDFLLLGALAGPAALGIYAVASKFAEVMRLIPTAMNYVLYPRFAGLGLPEAAAQARRLLPRATVLTLVMTPLMAVVSWVALPVLYGSQFHGAVTPAVIIIIGLCLEGAAAVSSAFLLGGGRPGLNSVGMGVGTALTVVLDIVLIPRFGAIGGAVTSATAYLVTAVLLTALANRLALGAGSPDGGLLVYARRTGRQPARHQSSVRTDSALRRAFDLAVSAVVLLAALPLMIVVGAAVRLSSPGPVLYRQIRIGRDGQPFTMLKFRSMVCTSPDHSGPVITAVADPRVTAIGAVIRATKLDELPQLLNVLRGDMTLIGPRPEVERFLPCYRPDELDVLRVRPGLTGAGQVYYLQVQAPQQEPGQNAEAYYEHIELHPKLAVDLAYLRRRGVSADMAIVLRTVLLISHIKDAGRVHTNSGRGTSPSAGGHPHVRHAGGPAAAREQHL